MTIKNIIFDFGGVLYRIRYQNIAEAFAACGVPDFDRIYSKQKQNDIMDQWEVGLLPVADFFSYVRSLTDVPLTEAQIADCWNAILIDFPVEHEQLLARLHPHYRLFLFSNTNALSYEAFTRQMRQQYGYDIFEKWFEKTYFSQLMHVRKPNKEGFLRIMEENQLHPEETLFIDDSPQHVEGAKLCGLNACHLKDGQDVTDLFDDNGFLKLG